MNCDDVAVLVRIATMDESPQIAFLLQQAFIEYKLLYTPAAFSATTPTASQIKERWNEGPVWVAVQNDKLVGTLAAVSKSSGLYIRSMAVLPAVRGQGIAAQLLREVDHFATDRRYKRWFLSTTPFLKQAIRLYEHLGFQRSDEGPLDLLGTPLFTMERLLDWKEE